jgi:peptidoglycan hydrolase-like protein with peptidoglycan-binding domain
MDGAMTDAFISYHSEDRAAVAIIAEELKTLKLDVWFDSALRSGSAYDSQISQELESAKAVLTCWTPGAVKSDWVRAEADFARTRDKLIPCVLQPTELPPPFNLVQAPDLSAWAGQDNDPAWLKIVERIGQLIDRPGLATYRAVMRPSATLPELKAWVAANAIDPLSADVWGRISALEGENAEQKAAREAAESAAREQLRKLQATRSRELAKARGLRDPARERRQRMLLLAAVLALAVIFLGWIGYSTDRDRRLHELDSLSSPADIAGFIAHNWYHPVRSAAEEKLRLVDERSWADARQNGRTADFQIYIDTFSPFSGQHLQEAGAAKQAAEKVGLVQQNLRRLGLYRGPADGALSEATRNTIARFRLRTGLPVSYGVDDQLIAELDKAIERWIRPTPAELRASQPGPPTEDDMIWLAGDLGVELPALLAVYDVEGAGRGFDAEGRPLIVFSPTIFVKNMKKADGPTASPAPEQPRTTGANPGSSDPTKPPTAWDRLEAAFRVDPEAAYAATSFGAFQIIGLNAKRMGFASAGEYARFVSQSELNQYAALFLYGSNSPVLAALKARDWEGFASAYLGMKNPRYAARLAEAYEREAALLQRRVPWEAVSLGSRRSDN